MTEGHYAFKTGISVKHLKISPSPITQSINQNNAKGVSLIHEGALAGVRDGLWPIQDSLLFDLSPWQLGLALKGHFGLKKQNLFTENCLIHRNSKDPLISLKTVDHLPRVTQALFLRSVRSFSSSVRKFLVQKIPYFENYLKDLTMTKIWLIFCRFWKIS